MLPLAPAVFDIASGQQDDRESLVPHHIYLRRSQVQLPTPKFNVSFKHHAAKRTRSINPRQHMWRSSLRLPKYISISNSDSELLFDASSYLNSLTPTKLADRISKSYLKEPMRFKVLDLG